MNFSTSFAPLYNFNDNKCSYNLKELNKTISLSCNLPVRRDSLQTLKNLNYLTNFWFDYLIDLIFRIIFTFKSIRYDG